MAAPTRDELPEVVRFLRSPEAYADRPARVELVETHFSWVFLSDAHAYKLNKPIRFHHIDFTSLAKRKANCERALQLNRRLAEPIYLGVVPLTIGGDGLELEGVGQPIEWLLKMRRLPDDSMLDKRLESDRIARSELMPAIMKLVAFYQRTPSVHWNGDRYASELRGAIIEWGEQLSAFPAEIETAEADRLVTALLGFVAGHGPLLERRVEHGYVVDAHGDLRPEHIALTQEPQIIDCLEFSDHLRLLDAAEEIGGLALECERLGHDDVGRSILEAYQLEADDVLPPELLAFHRARQALRRAVLCAWHLEDPMYAATQQRWVDRTHWYLRTGREALSRMVGDDA